MKPDDFTVGYEYGWDSALKAVRVELDEMRNRSGRSSQIVSAIMMDEILIKLLARESINVSQ